MGSIRANRAVRFSASLSTPQQSFTANAFTKIIYSVENEDTSSAYDAALGRFTAPVAGTYLLTASFFPNQASSATRLVLSFVKNGAELQRTCDQIFTTGGFMLVPPSILRTSLVVGDYIEFFMFSNAALTNFTDAAYNRFSGTLL